MSTPNSKLRWRVLVFPAGTENGIEIFRALSVCKEVALLAAASAGSHHAPFLYRAVHEIPDVRRPGWQAALIRLIEQEAVDFVFPANDIVIDALVAVREQLPCPVVLPPSPAVLVARSKRETFRRLAGAVPLPASYASPDEIEAFPVFVKPDAGYGGQGARLVRSRDALAAELATGTDLLIQEYLPGAEFTVDCFTDRHGRLLVCEGRERVRVRMGTSMHGRGAGPERTAEIRSLGEAISSRLGLRGAWFFQLKEDAGGALRLLEVDVRIAGTMALNRVRGVNFPLLSLYDLAGLDVEVQINPGPIEIDRCLLNRFRHAYEYETVYVDLDDTLVLNERLNLTLVTLLYQSLNAGRRIVLMTKSLEEDLGAYLERWRISELFDEVIHLPESASKADFIEPAGAIFIDDSYSQRREVAERHGIPTFDPSMVEALLDERI